MNMKKTLTKMASPFTGGRVYEVEDVERKEFRKESFEVHVRYYLCEDTGEQFTDGDQDELFTNELYSQWRVRHGVPFPDEIRKIRERYGLNFTQMSKILGFGVNQWRQYEAGMVPSESQGKMIRAVSDKRVMRTMLEESRSQFTEQEYENIRSRVENSTSSAVDRFLAMLLYGKDDRLSVENGFGEQNPDKLAQMVKYIVSRCRDICPTKLNKLMFYSDFMNYRRYGRSISGLKYRAIQFGPVPEHYATIYDQVDGLTKCQEILLAGGEKTVLGVSEEVQVNLLSEQELSTIEEILAKFGKMLSRDIVELSHQEPGWKDNVEHHSIIPYSYAFDLTLD